MANLGLSQAANNFVNAYSMGKQQKLQKEERAKSSRINDLLGGMLMGSSTDEQSQELASLDSTKFLAGKNYLAQQEAKASAAQDVMNQEEDIKDLTFLMSTNDRAAQDEYLQNRISTIVSRGGDPSQTQMLLQMPQDQRSKAITMIGKQNNITGMADTSAQPSSVREWEYYNALDDSDKQKYLNMKRANQLFKEGDVTMQVDPVAGGSAVVTETGAAPTTQSDAQAKLTGQAAEKAASTKAAEQAIAMSEDAFTKTSTVRTAISNIDEAISLIDQGAQTGPIMAMLPSVQRASMELDALQGRMGLDVVSNTTFGALSESELKFALKTALPKSLEGPALKDWLQRKKDAHTKLVAYLEDAAVYLGTPGNTIAGFLKEQKTTTDLSQMSDDDLFNF